MMECAKRGVRSAHASKKFSLFVAFSHVGSFHETLRRSPRLLARHSEKPLATILTPVRKHLRRFIEENKGKSVSQSGTKPSFE